MEKTKSQTSQRSKLLSLRSFRTLILLSIVVLVIVSPIAVMFGRKKKSDLPKSDVLVPLYVYPAPGAWDPLFTAIASHPSLNFVVVVNPSSGPGPGAGPDANYTAMIPKLNSYANVRTVGYVSTNYTKRDVQLAVHDVDKYAAWAGNSSVKGLGMRGIFLDETPTEYSNTSGQYYEIIASAIKSSKGLGENPLVIHNPGQIPDARYLSYCDLTVVFEGTYSTYHIYGFQKRIANFRKSSKRPREALASIIHGVSLPTNDLAPFLKETRKVSGSIFITGLSIDYYASFWAGLPEFLQGMITT